MTDAAVTVKGLRRRFGPVLAVDDLTFDVPRGQVTGFLGPNGAGKTTTLRMILGLLRPDAGEVRIFGEPLGENRRALLRRVGALIEGPSLYEHLTGRQNLEIARRLAGVAPGRVDACLARVGLTDAAGRPAGGYSLGMKQRLGLALALLQEPYLLVLDEPTNGLDPAGIQEIRTLLGRLAREEGVTVLLSSHLLAEVEQGVSHLVILRRGRTVFQGPLAELNRLAEAHVCLRVDRPQEAAAHLKAAGWELLPEAGDDGELRIRSGGREELERLAADLATALVEAGFRLHHLSEERPRLESSFLSLTGEEDA